MDDIKLIAFDLDGTLTQHKTPLSQEYREILYRLQERYRLVMVGAGTCARIFAQMEEFPLDIIGNYGMQYARYDAETHSLIYVRDEVLPCDRAACEAKMEGIRRRHGFTEYAGKSIEFHSSGAVTLPLLGTAARAEDKLAFDPDRSRRRAFYGEVINAFPEYNVFVGGSSSFDLAPRPYNKYYALDLYCTEHGIAHSEVLFVGDDYGLGGNDESVYLSDFGFLPIDDYRTFGDKIAYLLK